MLNKLSDDHFEIYIYIYIYMLSHYILHLKHMQPGMPITSQ